MYLATWSCSLLICCSYFFSLYTLFWVVSTGIASCSLIFFRVQFAVNPDIVIFFISRSSVWVFFIFYISLLNVFSVWHVKYRYKNFLNHLLVLSSVSILDLFLFIFLVIMGQIFLVLCIPDFWLNERHCEFYLGFYILLYLCHYFWALS